MEEEYHSRSDRKETEGCEFKLSISIKFSHNLKIEVIKLNCKRAGNNYADEKV